MAAHERARERELHRYYLPWLETFRATEAPVTLSSSRPDGHVPRSSRDKALTAFAQLACHRLGIRRGAVTAIGSTHQYILAEGTKTLSLMDDSSHEKGDELWCGNARIPRGQGVSEDALRPDLYTAYGPDGSTHAAPALVVKNLATDERYKNRGFAGAVSFYAGVPITTKLGHPIAVYAVSDDHPRDGLRADELKFMVEMAVVIAEHLEVIKNNRARARGERLIQGIGTFIRGRSEEEAPESDTPTPVGLNGGLLKRPASASGKPVAKRRLSARLNSSTSSFKGLTISDANIYDPVATTTVDEIGIGLEDSSSIAVKSVSWKEPNPSTGNQNLGPSPNECGASNKVSEKTSFPYSRVFDRAAKILRHCMSADGVVFLDTSSANLSRGTNRREVSGSSVSTLAHTSRRKVSDGPNRPPQMSVQNEESADEDSSGSSAPDHRDARNSNSTGEVNHSEPAAVLALAMRTTASSATIHVSERELRRLVRRHPQGIVYIFDEYGRVASSEESSDSAMNFAEDLRDPAEEPHSNRDLQTGRAPRARNALSRTLPGARSIVFLPLWDFAKERWFASCLIWSTDSARLTNIQDDLAYLNAFCHSITNEVARINLLKSDHAKSTFLANISHELRSPLHGILGSIEFLHDTQMDDFQSDLVIAVEICSKTLLDTINSVLDYAKINSLAKPTSKGRGMNSKAAKASLDSSLTEEFNLAILVEEAVEAVYAGQVFRTANPNALQGSSPPQSASAKAPRKQQDLEPHVMQETTSRVDVVRLTLNIDAGPDWAVVSQPGSVRRIVMNILGNAIKYTLHGSIHVSLEIDDTRKKDSRIHSCLTVVDTGIGMSDDFVRNHAFTAFSQEDSLVSGTGLGLSIIRQIVDSLGGKIGLRSLKDVGTEIKIWLSLSAGPKSLQLNKSLLTRVPNWTGGMSVCLLRPQLEGKDKANEVRGLQTMPTIEESIRDLFGGWFGMEVISEPTMDNIMTDFFMYPKPPPIEYLLDTHGTSAATSETPIIILTTNALEAASLRRNGIHHLCELGRIIEVIAQPCGPQKLGKVLQRCMRKTKETEGSPESNMKWPTTQVPRASRPAKPHRNTPTERPNRIVTNMNSHDSKQGSAPTAVTAFKSRIPPRSQPRESYNHTIGDPSSEQVPIRTRPRVLVVDDNHINLQLLVTFVRKTNHPHESASDGLQALEAYKRAATSSNPFRYILMDISMPVMNGLTATREIRKFERENKIEQPTVIIALTGLGSESSAVQEAEECGFDQFLEKPIKFAQLEGLLV